MQTSLSGCGENQPTYWVMEAQQTITRQPQTTSLGRRFKKAVLIGFAIFGFGSAALLGLSQTNSTYPACTVTSVLVVPESQGGDVTICHDPTHRDFNADEFGG